MVLWALLTAHVLAAAPPVEQEPPEVLALVVGNSRSSSAARPDLRYADDDALKYGAMWRGLAAPNHVRVLTTLDADTAHARDAAADQPGAPRTRWMVRPRARPWTPP